MSDTNPPAPPASSGNLPAEEPKKGYKFPPVETRFGGPRAPKPGRKPKSIDQVRKLAIEIGNQPLGETGLTRIQAMLISMSSSKNPRDRELFLQYAYGKVRDELKITVSDADIDKAIKAELERLAAGGQTAASGAAKDDSGDKAI